MNRFKKIELALVGAHKITRCLMSAKLELFGARIHNFATLNEFRQRTSAQSFTPQAVLYYFDTCNLSQLELADAFFSIVKAPAKLFIKCDHLETQIELFNKGCAGFISDHADSKFLIDLLRKASLDQKSLWQHPISGLGDTSSTQNSILDKRQQNSFLKMRGLTEQTLKFGTGGFTIEIPSNSKFTKNQLIHFDLGIGSLNLKGSGRVQWSFQSHLGVEILFLENIRSEEVLSLFTDKSAFIPSHSNFKTQPISGEKPIYRRQA